MVHATTVRCRRGYAAPAHHRRVGSHVGESGQFNFRKLDGYAEEVIQFDVSINPGNSGGPVINPANQVVGIASAKACNGR